MPIVWGVARGGYVVRLRALLNWNALSVVVTRASLPTSVFLKLKCCIVTVGAMSLALAMMMFAA